MWKIRGVEHRLGDSVFVMSGMFAQKVERYTIIRPRKINGGWPFGSDYDSFAWASNGDEIIRISRRGRIVDQIISSRKIVPFEEGLRLELAQRARGNAPFPKVAADLSARLDDCISPAGKVRILVAEGWKEVEIATYLHLPPQRVREIILIAS